MTKQLWIYDTTLRDGTQREGISVSIEDKLRIARQLDRLGVPFIEGGWPGANPKDVQFFWQLQEEPLTNAEIVAFCSTRRPHISAATDPMLQAILAAGTRWVTIFGKSWDLHVTEGLKTSLEENLEMIRDTIAYLRSSGRRSTRRRVARARPLRGRVGPAARHGRACSRPSSTLRPDL